MLHSCFHSLYQLLEKGLWVWQCFFSSTICGCNKIWHLDFILFFTVCPFFWTHIHEICTFEHSFLNKMIKFSLVSSLSVWWSKRDVRIYACTHTYAHIYMHAATHTATHAQVYTTLVKNCGTKLDFLLGSDYHLAYNYISDNWGIPWQVAYSISCTEQY